MKKYYLLLALVVMSISWVIIWNVDDDFAKVIASKIEE